MTGPLVAGMGGLAALTLIVFWSARRSFGKVSLHVSAGRLWIADDRAQIAHAEVTAWTIDRSSARIYTRIAGWRFRCEPKDEDGLRSLLAGAFGSPLVLKRRGTKRARIIAAVVALAGVLLAATAIALHIPVLVVVGVPTLVFGLAALGALSQRVR